MSDQTLRRAVESFAFEDAFLDDIGWDQLRRTPLAITIGETTYSLAPVAEKRGFQVYRVRPAADGKVPDRKTRLAIHRRVLDAAAEHALVFTDAAETRQVWEFPSRRRKNAWPDHAWHAGQDVGGLVAMLRQLEVSVEEEDGLTISDVTGRTEAFDKDKVTKAFYREFSTVRTAFRDAVAGIDALPDREWYASLMLNRLMFLYFIQEKGFLDRNPRYLRDRLERSAALLGPNQFHSFYRSFLLALFHRGLASVKPHAADVRALIGEVPYLNGGLFDPHELEASHDIAVPDTAFAAVFAFFDRWTWTLDYRELRSGREINPDVLGYIFEQTINNKQTGAYYTKEDVTGYIVRNTLLPHLLDEAARECRVAFTGPQSVWRLLRESPDEYVYPALQQTKRNADGAPEPFPPHIAAGLTDVAARGPWNAPAPDPWGLPTETWREAVARRQRYTALRETLAAGGITSTADLVTHNLDIEQFALDVVETAEGPELVRAVWHALRRVAVLDPTCGSGAFLFAALERLEPLYTACLAQMRRLVAEAQADGRLKGELMSDFRREIALADDRVQHPSESYFVLKRILLDNLYGVDIMPEAVEICKLRLFLKLAAQVTDDRNLEPLPDLDFNVRAGNALVGYATRESVAAALTTTAVRGGAAQGNLLLGGQADALADFEAGLARVQRLASAFRDQQQDHATAAEPEAKQTLRDALRALTDTLDRALATEHGVKPGSAALDAWRERVRPFHWFAEFYGVMERGGFDAIVGNPPYVARKLVDYAIPGPSFPDIYASVTLRQFDITHTGSRIGFIVPLSLGFSNDYADLRRAIATSARSWFSSYDNIPAALFYGVSQRCTIWIGERTARPSASTAALARWRSVFRPYLLDLLEYVPIPEGAWDIVGQAIPKVDSPRLMAVLQSVGSTPVVVPSKQAARSQVGFSQAARNFVSVFAESPPTLDAASMRPVAPSKVGFLRMPSEPRAQAAFAALAGELYLWYWMARGDGFDVTGWVVGEYLGALDRMGKSWLPHLTAVGRALLARKNEALVFKKNAGKYVGNYNWLLLTPLTRRADLLVLAGLGHSRIDVEAVLEQMMSVRSINVFAGEKNIPDALRAMYPTPPASAAPSMAAVDAALAAHYGYTPAELDAVVHFLDRHPLNGGADRTDVLAKA